MTIDRRKFKTPFYRIQIQDPTGKRKVNLPHHILRLVQKIELTEVWDNKNNDKSALTIEFVEGSREPASVDKDLGTKGLYQLPNEGPGVDMNVAGSITNRTGAITDLRFSGDNGITFITDQEASTGRISDAPIENVENDVVKRLHPGEDPRPIFLFQERNKIKLTWGYIEDPSGQREEIYTMQVFRVQFPESNQIRTTVIAYDDGVDLDKVVPTTRAITFGERRSLIEGDEVDIHIDQATPELVQELCEKAGVACIVSPVVTAPLMDTGHRKVWFVGQSFEQFMKGLAKDHDAVYKVKTDPSTGRTTLFFVTKQDMKNKRIERRDIPNLFKFKSPDSIIKDIRINADFRVLVGKAESAVSKAKKETKVISQIPLRQFENSNKFSASRSTPLPSFVEGSMSKGLVDGVLGPENPIASIAEQTPKELEDQIEDAANTVTDQLDERKVALEMTTIGLPQINFGTINIQNIGVRYSGEYQVRKVTHTIDNTGYVSKVLADTLSEPKGGTITPNQLQTESSNQTELLQQFKRYVGEKGSNQSRNS